MPLIRRFNGSNPDNLVRASWWNDFLDLFTGQMHDQDVTIRANVTISPALTATPTTQTLTAHSNGDGQLATGTYQYAYAWVDPHGGESLPSATMSVTTAAGQSVRVNVPIARPTDATILRLYRTKANQSILYFNQDIPLATYTYKWDTIADASLNTARFPATQSFYGGKIVVKNGNGSVVFKILNNGEILLSTAKIGVTNSGDVLDASGFDTFLSSRGGANLVRLRSGTTDTGVFGTNGLLIPGGTLGKIGTGDMLDTSGNNLYVKARGNTNPVIIQNNGQGTAKNLAAFHDGWFQVNSGKIGVAASGDVLDASGFDTFLKARTDTNLIRFMIGSFEVGWWHREGINITSNNASITVGNYLGVKKSNGTKLGEFKGDGNFVIGGASYFTNGTGFDGFDVAEAYQVDEEYAPGTVVCLAQPDVEVPYNPDYLSDPLTAPLLTKCTHDACSTAMIISHRPGLGLGAVNYPSLGEGYYDPLKPLSQTIALTGRLFAKTAYEIAPKAHVTSDGRGGIRAVLPGESCMALGVTIAPTTSGMVPILVRPGFISLPPV